MSNNVGATREVEGSPLEQWLQREEPVAWASAVKKGPLEVVGTHRAPARLALLCPWGLTMLGNRFMSCQVAASSLRSVLANQGSQTEFTIACYGGTLRLDAGNVAERDSWVTALRSLLEQQQQEQQQQQQEQEQEQQAQR